VAYLELKPLESVTLKAIWGGKEFKVKSKVTQTTADAKLKENGIYLPSLFPFSAKINRSAKITSATT